MNFSATFLSIQYLGLCEQNIHRLPRKTEPTTRLHLTWNNSETGEPLLCHTLCTPVYVFTIFGGKVKRVVRYTHLIDGHNNGNSSSVFHSVPLTSSNCTGSGDDGDLVHYCAKFIALSLVQLNASGRLSGWMPIIAWGKGALAERFCQ